MSKHERVVTITKLISRMVQDTHRLVAIKKTEYIFDDLVDCKRTLREIGILTRLFHSSIIKLVDIIVPEDLLKFNDIYLEVMRDDIRDLEN
ncbi:mapk2, putative [Perkinsus marinus ATCC 50983]|uniref:Mapk2, putative n=1 Tax=Perkinsus marinus (strain ATCC 50983 / TXsc) TaxID=423536 RepID=C5M150_PERM5|nr:mapk2, putative [Perkinsus marinus ATCC 50983]EEQ97280.1 mapk2, putative [Perkinsus marinus ATCC 50983]|eukprot:XP_002764563.1 mapk2, putative [Perkinsus marinus ATCC 50983]